MDTATKSRITRYTPTCLTAREWALAAAPVRAAVYAARPMNAEHAKSLLSRACLFLAASTVWDRRHAPELGRLLTAAAIRAHCERLRAAGKRAKTREGHRTDLRRLERAVAGAPVRQVQRGVHRIHPLGDARLQRLLEAGATLATVAAAWELLTGVPLARTQLDPFTGRSDINCDAGALAAAGDVCSRAILFGAISGSGPVTGAAGSNAVTRSTTRGADRKPMSRAAALRHAKAALAEKERLQAGPRVAAAPVDLAAPTVSAIGAYRPRAVGDAQWALVQTACRRLIAGYRPSGPQQVSNIARHITDFLLWVLERAPRDDRDAPVAPAELLRAGLVDAWVASLTSPPATRATQRMTVRRAVGSLTPAADKPAIAYQPIAAPYSPDDAARLRRLAANQPTASRRKNLGFVVGLGAGAGLDGRDLRHVAREHIREQTLPDGTAVLTVTVAGGDRPRTTVVRHEYLALVRMACRLHDELISDPAAPVLGRKPSRRNITTPAVDHAVTARDGEKVDVDINRLRSTWLLSLLCAPVPLTVLLTAAGLKSARSVADLLPHCPQVPRDQALVLLATAGLEPRAVAR